MKILTCIPRFIDSEGKILKDENGSILERAPHNTETKSFYYLIEAKDVPVRLDYEPEEEVYKLSEEEQIIEMCHPLHQHNFSVDKKNEEILKNGRPCLFLTTTNKFVPIEDWKKFKRIDSIKIET